MTRRFRVGDRVRGFGGSLTGTVMGTLDGVKVRVLWDCNEHACDVRVGDLTLIPAFAVGDTGLCRDGVTRYEVVAMRDPHQSDWPVDVRLKHATGGVDRIWVSLEGRLGRRHHAKDLMPPDQSRRARLTTRIPPAEYRLPAKIEQRLEALARIASAEDFFDVPLTTPHQETVMRSAPVIASKLFITINDQEHLAENLNDDTLLGEIQKCEAEIKRLEAMDTKPRVVQQRIDDLRSGVAALVKFMDERFAASKS